MQQSHLILSRLDRLEQNINDQFNKFNARLDSFETRLGNFEARLDGFETRLDGFESRLGSLDQKVDERLHDIRPMWEALNARLDDFEAEVKDRLKKMEFEMRGLKKSLGKAYMDVLITQEEQEDRINQLEQNLK